MKASIAVAWLIAMLSAASSHADSAADAKTRYVTVNVDSGYIGNRA